MSNAPLMPMATAVWLVENTTLTFKQIANFCKLHEVEIQGIADGEVAKGIKAYNPIISGQLSKEEIELSSKNVNRPLQIKSNDIEISNNERKIKKIGQDAERTIREGELIIEVKEIYRAIVIYINFQATQNNLFKEISFEVI